MVDASLQQIPMISLYSLMPQLHLQDFFVQISLLVNLVSISEMNTLDSRQLLSFRPAIKNEKKVSVKNSGMKKKTIDSEVAPSDRLTALSNSPQ